MESLQTRLSKLDKDLSLRKSVCSSEGALFSFPSSLKAPFQTDGVGLVVCRRGCFSFTLNQKPFTAKAGETLFLPEDSIFQVTQESDDLAVFILIYQINPIRDLMGNLVISMHLCSQLIQEPCYVWKTGEEEEVVRYMSLLDGTLSIGENAFNHYEQKLLLLALTYRLCSIYNRKLIANRDSIGHKNETFMRLLQYIDQYYTQERGVEFYADKLCLSPKYLSALCKSICGYTVQELVFKAILRKSISLLKSTQRSIQEIADELNFPNASYFGTFFRKQTGMSPQRYRRDPTA